MSRAASNSRERTHGSEACHGYRRNSRKSHFVGPGGQTSSTSTCWQAGARQLPVSLDSNWVSRREARIAPSWGNPLHEPRGPWQVLSSPHATGEPPADHTASHVGQRSSAADRGCRAPTGCCGSLTALSESNHCSEPRTLKTPYDTRSTTLTTKKHGEARPSTCRTTRKTDYEQSSGAVKR